MNFGLHVWGEGILRHFSFYHQTIRC